MGLLDAPAPLFDWIDIRMGGVMLPGVRVAVWGIAGGLMSMLIYRAISAQERVARAKVEMARARRDLDAYDGEFTGAWPLMRRLLGLALTQVARVGGPAVVASLPLLCLLAWISTAYGYRFPEAGRAPVMDTRPPGYNAEWIQRESDDPRAAQGNPPRIVVRDNAERVVADIAMLEPVPLVHKRRWWNALLANPVGYLPHDGALRSVHLSLPRRELLAFGPQWIRGWEMTFFVPLLAASITLKILIRIE